MNTGAPAKSGRAFSFGRPVEKFVRPNGLALMCRAAWSYSGYFFALFIVAVWLVMRLP